MLKILKRFARREKSYIGLDIGSYAVKTLELLHEKEGSLTIKNVGYAKVGNPGSRESLIQAIKESIAKANITSKEVNIAISGPSVIIRFIELPRMSEDELKSAISFEAEKYIPFNISEVIVDHQTLIPRLGENKMLVLLVAAKKDFINEYLNIVNEAGLTVGILDVASFANVNAFLIEPDRKKDEIAALIDIGAKATDINIIDEGVLYLTRCVRLGGDDITKILSESLSVDLKNAEALKVNPADRKDEVSEKIDSILRDIIDEIRLSFGYYENQSGKTIERAYLIGGGTRTVNFRSMLKENLGIEVEPWNPIGFMRVDLSIDTKVLESVKDQLAVAVGLALR